MMEKETSQQKYPTVVLSMDGDCGCCLVGENIQEGEVEFVNINSAPESIKQLGICAQEKWAMTQAHKRLCKRLDYQLGYYTATNHWGN